MAIITKEPVEKGVPGTFTLNKTDLAALPEVSGNSYYSNQAVWKRVWVTYTSTIVGQQVKLAFDATLASPTAIYSNSATADNAFEVTRIIIEDFDAGILNIDRVSLPVAEFDVIHEFLPEAQSVAFTGTEETGQTLTGSYTYFDGDGDLEGTTIFKWYRSDDATGTNKAAIAGATSSTYLIDAADLTKFLQFSVTPVALTGDSPGDEVLSVYSTAISAPSVPVLKQNLNDWFGGGIDEVSVFLHYNSPSFRDAGNVFIADSSYTLKSVTPYISKSGSATGQLFAAIYDAGDPEGFPEGTLLATSTNLVDIAGLPSGYANEFFFPDVPLVAGQKYVVMIALDNGFSNASNTIKVFGTGSGEDAGTQRMWIVDGTNYTLSGGCVMKTYGV